MSQAILKFILSKGDRIHSPKGVWIAASGQTVAATIGTGMLAATGVGAFALAWLAIPVVLLAVLTVAMLMPVERRIFWTRVSPWKAAFTSADPIVELRPPICC